MRVLVGNSCKQSSSENVLCYPKKVSAQEFNTMKSTYGILALLISLFLLPTMIFAQESGVSASHVARLAKGVNVTRWFWLNEDTSDQHYDTYISEEQAQAIRDAGFTHVRLPIEPKLFLNEANPTQLDPKLL